MAWWMTKARRLLGGGARPDPKRQDGMTAEERFLFDLEGYLVIKGVLSAPEVGGLQRIAERNMPASSERPAYGRLFRVSAWGAPYQSLIDHPRIVPYLVELIGPRFRLDHDFCIFTRKGGRGQDLHGTESDENPDHWYEYRDGVMRNGLTVVTFFLTAAQVGDGGVFCVARSPKRQPPGGPPADVRDFRRRPHYVVQPPIEAGGGGLLPPGPVHRPPPPAAQPRPPGLPFK